ncbi:MAG: ATP-binding protein [Chloroflexota bacterium]|nr:ATP-binding protein [Chloroflexota bacterium]
MGGLLVEAELPSWGPAVLPESNGFAVEPGRDAAGAFAVETSRSVAGAIGHRLLPVRLAELARNQIYAFRAERRPAGSIGFVPESELLPDASNLPRVLNSLQANGARLARYNAAVNKVFPDIRGVSVRGQLPDRLEVLTWTVPMETEREDLAVPLAESGSGVGQVLAMLYVALTAPYPRAILVDEPQSFLHPGAVRKLLDVLRTDARHAHQYVVATHSSAAVASAEPGALFVVRKVDLETRISPVNPGDALAMRDLLSEVGARLADVFGADDVLWVEGRTKEACFPPILRRLGRRPLLGTSVLTLRNTGDLDGRHARLAVEVYRRLSEGAALLPPAVGFVLDREDRSPEGMADLARRLGSTVRFLPRRAYENYLLNPAAVAAVVATLPGFDDGAEPPSADDVRTWLANRKWDRKYVDEEAAREVRDEAAWTREAHGARLLADLFAHFSEGRTRYEEVAYGLALTEWLLANALGDLAEVAEFLDDILGARAEGPREAR